MMPSMSDTTDPTVPHHDSTTDPSVAGLSVNEAAELLDISPDAVRARIRRGTLRAEKHENVWTVYLSDTTRHDTDRHTMGPGRRHDRTDPTVVHGTDLAPLVDLLADAMQRNADVMKQNADLAAAAAMWQTRAAHLEDQLKQLTAGEREDHEAFFGPESVAESANVETYRVAREDRATGLLERLKRWLRGAE